MIGFRPIDFEVLHMTQAIQGELLDILTDADLAYRLPGANPPLGALFREIGQVEISYTGSFRTLRQNFNYPPVDPALETSVEKLRAWYAQLNAELDAALLTHSETDIQETMVDRGFPMPLLAHLHTYREALLIFYGKATCYLHALGKPQPPQMAEWIG